ncbi:MULTISPECIES: acylphosphatase [Dickeya]|uniref:acylphosphatase n=1 Tax=Dickeya TaxID=204037 RepID=UPI00352A2A04
MRFCSLVRREDSVSIVSVKGWVYGLVQGVGFRYHTRQHAQALGITGYVRNCDEGSVELVACGEAQAIEQLIDWLKCGGPPYARVDKVLIEPHPAAAFQGFSIRE